MVGSRSPAAVVRFMLILVLQQQHAPTSGNKVNVQLELTEESLNQLLGKIIDNYSNNNDRPKYVDCKPGCVTNHDIGNSEMNTISKGKFQINNLEVKCNGENCNILRNQEPNDDKKINHYYNAFTLIANHTRSISTENNISSIINFSPLKKSESKNQEPANFRSAKSEVETDEHSHESANLEATPSIFNNERAVSLLTKQATLLEELLKRVERTGSDNRRSNIIKERYESLIANRSINKFNKPIKSNLTPAVEFPEEKNSVNLPSIDVTDIKTALKNDPWIQRLLHFNAASSISKIRRYDMMNQEPRPDFSIMAPITFM